MNKFRHFYFGIPLFFFMIASMQSLKSQTCFSSLEINENGTVDLIGLEAAHANAEIEDLSCQVRSALPIEFQNDFKVYDYSFYHHMKSQNINLEQEFSEVINMASEESEFYLLIGKKITADQGVDFYVDLKLPLVPGCFEEEHITFRKLQIKNELLRNSGFTYLTNLAEVLRELQKHIEYLTKECCYSSFKNSCSGFWCDYKPAYSDDYGLTDQDLIQWYDEPDNHDLRCNLTELYDHETEMDADFKRAVSRFIIAYHKTTKNLFYSLSDVDESNIPEIHDDIIRSGLDAFLPNYMKFKDDYFNAFKFQFFNHIDLEDFSTLHHFDDDVSKSGMQTTNFGDWFRDSWASLKGTGDIINKAIVIANEIRLQFATTLTPILAYGAEIVWAITKFAVLEFSGINDILEIYEGINLLKKPEYIPACTKIGLGLLAIIPWSKVGKVFYKMGGIFRSIYHFWGNLLNGFSKVNDYLGEIAGKLSYEAGEFLVEKAGKKMNLGFLCRIFDLGCFVKNTPVLMANNKYNFTGNPFRNNTKALAVAAAMPIVAVPIQEVQLLDYALAHETVNEQDHLIASTDEDLYLGLLDGDPYTSPQQKQRDKYDLNDTDWYSVSFDQIDGTSKCHFALQDDWIKRQGYETEKVVILNLPEQGINGPFRVTAIKHIIPQKKPSEDAGDGFDWKPITGLFEHQSNQVYEISFDNGEELGVTYQHPIFSVTEGDWRLAGELEIGEEVLTKEGEATVISSAKKGGSETVYNLEVQELHNFLVGESGIVVHNNCLKVIAKQADINDLENAVQATGITQLGVQKTLKEVGDAGTTGAIAKGGKLTKAELFALWAKARKFEAEHALTKVNSLYTQTGQRVTLKVTKTLPDGTKIRKDIVPDFVVKDRNSFKIIDAKFTTKADVDFKVKSSLTKNQNEVFDWMKNGDNISIKVTANQSKLNDLGILTGENISVSAVDILKSKRDDLLDSDILNYY